jgi:hypothetical protein
MPITASFTASQSSDCTTFQITDTTDYESPEEKGDMGSRYLYLYNADGTLYKTVNFDYATYPSDVITITGLDKDYAFTVNMVLSTEDPVIGSVYSASKVVALVCYSKVAFFERQNKMVIEPSLLNNTEYLKDSMKIVLDIEAAKNAEADTDVLNAQNAIDRIKFITDNDAI